jgi:tetratricopeptide (TPR) repeat protein
MPYVEKESTRVQLNNMAVRADDRHLRRQKVNGWLGDVDRHLAAGQTEEAQKIISQILSADAQNASAFRLRGNAFAMTKNYKEAAAAYREAIAINPADYDSYAGLGEALLLSDDKKAGEDALRQSIELNPLDPRARVLLAVLLKMSGRQEEFAALKKNSEKELPLVRRQQFEAGLQRAL